MSQPDPHQPPRIGVPFLLHAVERLPGDPQVDDLGPLYAAVERMYARAMDRDIYSSPHLKAAVLLQTLVKLPCLEHSNEAFVRHSAEAFLALSGHHLSYPPEGRGRTRPRCVGRLPGHRPDRPPTSRLDHHLKPGSHPARETDRDLPSASGLLTRQRPACKSDRVGSDSRRARYGGRRCADHAHPRRPRPGRFEEPSHSPTPRRRARPRHWRGIRPPRSPQEGHQATAHGGESRRTRRVGSPHAHG